MKKILSIVFVLLNYYASAQVGILSQYHFNYVAINPALAGESGSFAIKGMVGNQFNGNLRFNQLSHMLVLDGQLYNKTGLAFQSSSDNYGNGSGNNLGLSLSKGIEAGNLLIKGGLSTNVSILPNFGLAGAGNSVAFNTGLGLFMSYEGAFVGVSNAGLYNSKNAMFKDYPTLVNVGYIGGDEENLSYNVNLVYGRMKDINTYDINLKLWLSKTIALAGSYRMNNVYPNLYSKKNYFIPSAEFKCTDDLVIGLAYNTNSIRFSNTSPGYNQNFKMNGIFQFYVRYNKANKAGDSWYYNQF